MTGLAIDSDVWDRLFDFEDYGQLLGLVQYSLFAAAVLGVVGGVIGVFVMQRDMAFAVHGISELSFAGAAGETDGLEAVDEQRVRTHPVRHRVVSADRSADGQGFARRCA